MRGLWGLVLAVVAQPVLAQQMSCPPSVLDDLSLQEGAACSMRQATDRADLFTLSEAEALGSGIVLQTITQNYGCGANVLYMLSNCATGELVVFQQPMGPAMSDVVEEEPVVTGPDPEKLAAFESILASVRGQAAAGEAVSLQGALTVASRAGLTDAVGATVGVRMTFNGWTVPTDCGCALHYPELAP